VKWFNDAKGLRISSLQTAAARTCSSITPPSRWRGFRSLAEGQKVEYEVTEGPKGPQAANVRKV